MGWEGWPVHLQDADHWQRKAAQARDLAAKMSGENAKSVMLEIAKYYDQRASEVRTTAELLASPAD
jgi:hypothetical protein